MSRVLRELDGYAKCLKQFIFPVIEFVYRHGTFDFQSCRKESLINLSFITTNYGV